MGTPLSQVFIRNIFLTIGIEASFSRSQKDLSIGRNIYPVSYENNPISTYGQNGT